MGFQFGRSMSAPFFHVTNQTARQVPVFVRPIDYRAFLQMLRGGLDRFPVRLMAYSVLSNRWQLVVNPDGTDALAGFVSWAVTTHRMCSRPYNGTVGPGPLEDARLEVLPIATAAGLVRACRSVEREALRAGLVERAQDWPWCSLSDRYRSDIRVPLTPALFLGSWAWIDHVNAPTTPFDSAIEKCVGSLGSELTVLDEAVQRNAARSG